MSEQWMMKASHQWASRPADERFVSLNDMFNHFQTIRDQSRGMVVSNRALTVEPVEEGEKFDAKAITVANRNEHLHYAPTHWAFGQLASLAGAPGGYLRTLPSPVAADCINWSLRQRQIEDVGLLVQNNGDSMLRAATGPRYGRIWNADVAMQLMRLVQEQPNWTVPGEFGKAVIVTKDNTTLYASDRDMFVFLADEKNRIEVPNRRKTDLKSTTSGLARGFFTWNSEVGDKTFGLGTFFFDFACCNRIVWGGEDYKEIRIRHTVSAPDKFIEEVGPALLSYANSSTGGITKAIEDARNKRIDDVDEFLANRFGARKVTAIKAVHMLEEERPIETLWDATVGVTAFARSIQHQDNRVEMEREAGKILKLAA